MLFGIYMPHSHDTSKFHTSTYACNIPHDLVHRYLHLHGSRYRLCMRLEVYESLSEFEYMHMKDAH